MYRETSPVIESPLAAAEAINDMLLQSWGDKIWVFPALPDEWQEVVFNDLRAEGAFLISAVRKKGKTVFIRINSLAGEKCVIKSDLQGDIKMVAERNIDITEVKPGVLQVDINKGETVILYVGDVVPEFTIEPLEPQESLCNYFGRKKPWRLYGIPFND